MARRAPSRMGVAVATRRAAVRAKLLANMVAKCRWKPEGKGWKPRVRTKTTCKTKSGTIHRMRAWRIFFTGVETNPNLPEDTEGVH